MDLYLLKAFYFAGMLAPPVLLGLTWWGWFRVSHSCVQRWRRIVFFSALWTGTANVVLFGTWALWLHFHYVPESYVVQDTVGNIGICLLFYTFVAASAGQGKWRFLLYTSSVLSLIVWIPIGIL